MFRHFAGMMHHSGLSYSPIGSKEPAALMATNFRKLRALEQRQVLQISSRTPAFTKTAPRCARPVSCVMCLPVDRPPGLCGNCAAEGNPACADATGKLRGQSSSTEMTLAGNSSHHFHSILNLTLSRSRFGHSCRVALIRHSELADLITCHAIYRQPYNSRAA
jgi:hypothetical protein